MNKVGTKDRPKKTGDVLNEEAGVL